MKVVGITSFWLMCFVSWGQNIEFAEIRFYQDSIDPMTIHLVCKAKCQMYTSFARDAELIYWGDGLQSAARLIDTSYEYPGEIDTNPVKTYVVSHTYSSYWEDSTIYIGMYMADGLYEPIYNTYLDPASSTLCPIATINFAYMKSHTGIEPPHFFEYTFATDTAFRPFDFYPHILYDSSYRVDIQYVPGIATYPSGIFGGPFQLQYIPAPPSTTIVTFDSTDGHLIWYEPIARGSFMLSYVASIYKGDTFVCSMTRDFMLQTYDTLISTGIIPVSTDSGSSLRCYPSPSSSAFTIDMTAYSAGDRRIDIYDQLGQTVYVTSTTQDRLTVREKLPSGIYTVAVTQGAQRQYARIVIE